MTGLVAKLHSEPFLLEPIDGVIVAEPLRFISLGSIAAHRRHSLKRYAAQGPSDRLQRQQA